MDKSEEDESFRFDPNHPDFKRRFEKFQILREILSSEKKYLNDLKEIVEGYYEEIKKFSSDEFVYHIFSNIKDIYEFTKSFYSLLESSTEDDVGIAECFIKKHKVFLRLYSTYCQNYRMVYNSTEKLENENNIAKIIAKNRTKYGHCLKMTTYLQLPVLRITKYHLLLQRYLNLLDSYSSAYNRVLEALDLMKQVNDCINQEMSDEKYPLSTNFHKGCSLSKVNFTSLEKSLGSILKEGDLILVQTNKIHHVIVFQKMLMIQKANSLNKIMHTISNESLALLPTSSKSRTKSFTVIDYSQPKQNLMWQFVFKAKSEEEKNSWQSMILACMLNGYSKKLSDRIKNKINSAAVAETDGPPSKNRIQHNSNDIFRQEMKSFLRLNKFRHSWRSESLKDTTSGVGSFRHKFEHMIKRHLPNPAERIDKLFGTLGKPRLSSSTIKLPINKKFSSASVEISKNSAQDSAWPDCQRASNNKIVLPIDYLNKSFDGVEALWDDIERNTDEKNNKFRQVGCQIMPTFNENSTENNVKTTKIAKRYELEKVDKYEPNVSAQVCNDRSSKSSINSEEGYYSSHDSSSCPTIIESMSSDFVQTIVPNSSQPLFKLEKVSIKMIDFGEAIDSKEEAKLKDLLMQTTTLTVNLKLQPKQESSSSIPLANNFARESHYKSSFSGTRINNSFSQKSSFNSWQQMRPECDLGRKLHSFKVANRSSSLANASKLSANNNSVATNMDNNLNFVSVKELIKKFECKI